MKIKTNDKVKIIAGKDKGKIGKVLQILVGENKVVVEGANLMIKNQRPKKQGEKGQRIQFPAPMSLAKVMLVCPRCGQAARVGFKIAIGLKQGETENASGAKIKNRVCRRCLEVI